MNELDMIKLNIYEAYDNGEITYGEKEYLLEQVYYMYEADAYTKRMRKLDDYDLKNHNGRYTDLEKAKNLGQAMKNRGLDSRYSKNNKGYQKYISNTSISRPFNDEDASKDSFSYFKNHGDNSVDIIANNKNRRERKELYDSFVANRKKLQQTNDKLANKAPGSILAKQNAKKQTNTNESTFDTLLESINDLYYDD